MRPAPIFDCNKVCGQIRHPANERAARGAADDMHRYEEGGRGAGTVAADSAVGSAQDGDWRADAVMRRLSRNCEEREERPCGAVLPHVQCLAAAAADDYVRLLLQRYVLQPVDLVERGSCRLDGRALELRATVDHQRAAEEVSACATKREEWASELELRQRLRERIRNCRVGVGEDERRR